MERKTVMKKVNVEQRCFVAELAAKIASGLVPEYERAPAFRSKEEKQIEWIARYSIGLAKEILMQLEVSVCE